MAGFRRPLGLAGADATALHCVRVVAPSGRTRWPICLADAPLSSRRSAGLRLAAARTGCLRAVCDGGARALARSGLLYELMCEQGQETATPALQHIHPFDPRSSQHE